MARRALLQVEPAISDAASQGNSLETFPIEHTSTNVRGLNAQELQYWAATNACIIPYPHGSTPSRGVASQPNSNGDFATASSRPS